jgi:hypothetical protein
MEGQHRPDAETPLLAAGATKPDGAASSSSTRNKYPFFCAVLASMTSVLMGYSEYTRLLHIRDYLRLRAYSD